MQRQIVAKSLDDVGVVFTVAGRKFTAKAPHGILDPQPDPVLADMMSQMACFKWQGFTEEHTQMRRADIPPSLAEMRARLAGATGEFGPVSVPPDAPLALRRIAMGAANVAPTEPSYQPAPAITSFADIKAEAERRALAHADQQAPPPSDDLDLFSLDEPESDPEPILGESALDEAEKLDALAQLGEDAAAILDAAQQPAPPAPSHLLRKKR